MNILIYIILAIVGVAALAYLIVNVIPKKLHWILSIVFLVLIGYLSSLIYGGIMKPIQFDKEKKIRYAKVINNLKMIKDAQIAHRKIVGGYVGKPQDLLSFMDTAKFAITQVHTEEYIEVQSGGIEISKERRVVDTLGFKSLLDDFKGRDYKQMFKVPGTDANFEMETDSIEKNGITSEVFRARVDKAIVLAGMDEKLIKEERQALGGVNIKGKFVSVGSLSDFKVAGNWPPVYDNKKKKSKK